LKTFYDTLNTRAAPESVYTIPESNFLGKMGNFLATFLTFLSNYYQNFEQLVETPSTRGDWGAFAPPSPSLYVKKGPASNPFPFVSAPFCHFPARLVLVRETIKRRKIEGLLAVYPIIAINPFALLSPLQYFV
jgi:hypothetical protein